MNTKNGKQESDHISVYTREVVVGGNPKLKELIRSVRNGCAEQWDVAINPTTTPEQIGSILQEVVLRAMQSGSMSGGSACITFKSDTTIWAVGDDVGNIVSAVSSDGKARRLESLEGPARSVVRDYINKNTAAVCIEKDGIRLIFRGNKGATQIVASLAEEVILERGLNVPEDLLE